MCQSVRQKLGHTNLRARLLCNDFGSRNVALEYVPNTLNKIYLNLILALPGPGKLADNNNLQYKKYIKANQTRLYSKMVMKYVFS